VLVPSVVVTVTSTVGGSVPCGGETAVTWVDEFTEKHNAAVLPNAMDWTLDRPSRSVKPEPVTVTVVPPPGGPLLGEMLVTVG
jgi:hypothetical protein